MEIELRNIRNIYCFNGKKVILSVAVVEMFHTLELSDTIDSVPISDNKQEISVCS
jgi:hypothetical protein